MTTAPRPGAGAPRHYEFPHTERVTLDNGLRVVVANIPRLPLVTVLALVDAGSSNDPSGREGVASLTARALTEGTTRLDGASLALEMERLGSGIDSGSGWDEAMVHLTVMPTRLERAMTVMGDVLMTPSFAPRDVERLRAERLADLLQQQVEPRSLAHDKFSEVLFVAGSRYGVPSSGRTATVAHLDAEAVRAFHAARYGPHTTTLIFSGDVTLERAVALAHATLGAWTQTTVSPVAIDDQPRHEGRRVHLVHKSDAPQTELRVGHGGVPRRHLDYFPITVMNALLGGLFSSRINLNLREKNGYTYGARSGFDWRRGAGPFVVSTAVKTEVTDAATREILHEIARMREETVSADELSLATAFLDGVFPIRYETTQAVAHAMATAETYRLDTDYYSRYRDHVRSVTADDVRRVAREQLHPDQLVIVAVGDASVIRGPLEALQLGALHIEDTTV